MLTLLLGTVLLGAAAEKPVGATMIAQYDFHRRNDGDFLTPDGWSRVIQTGYPFYVDVGFTDTTFAVADRSLVFNLDGGHCALFSPKFRAGSEYNYVVQGQIKTEGLENDRGFLLLEFLDLRQRVVKQHLSPKIGGTQDWTTVTIGPIAPPDDSVRFLRIACFSQHGKEKDLKGSVYFDDLWIGRLPRVRVTSSSPYRLFPLTAEKVITVQVSGLDGRGLDSLFYLSDEQRRPLDERVVTLDLQADDSATADWDLPIKDVGFFHLDISLREGNRRILNADYPVTVVRAPVPASPDFGLSMSAPVHGLDHCEHLLTLSASRWLKLPLWTSARQFPNFEPRGTEFSLFLERLSDRGHTVVGAMEKAPEELLKNLALDKPGIADVFLLPKQMWSGEIEGLQAMYGLKVTHWQVGADDDTSFEGLFDPNLAIGELEAEMKLFGREVRLGVPWSWHSPPPKPGTVQFLSLSDAPPYALGLDQQELREWSPLSPEELSLALLTLREQLAKPAIDATVPPESVGTGPNPLPALQPIPAVPELWVQIAPASADKYPRQERVQDFFFRIIAAKQGGADYCQFVNSSTNQLDMFDGDGVPTEMYTIWRTAAEFLGGRQYQGRLYTDEVETRIFSDGFSASVVVWSRLPSKEILATGFDTKITDLWGRTCSTGSDTITHEIQTGPSPLILTQCNGALLRLQMETKFRKGQISSEVGRHFDELIITNPFPVTLSGTVSMEFPPAWRAKPTEANLQLQPGATQIIPIQFDIPQGMAQGSRLITIRFDVAGDRPYQFSIQRPYRLGLDEIDVIAQTQFLPDGTLEVRVAVVNLLDIPLRSSCLLRAYDRNVLIAAPILDLLKRDVTSRIFLIPLARDLIGRDLRLELRQLDGRRQFNVEIPVKAD